MNHDVVPIFAFSATMGFDGFPAAAVVLPSATNERRTTDARIPFVIDLDVAPFAQICAGFRRLDRSKLPGWRYAPRVLLRQVCAGLIVVLALGALLASQQMPGPSEAASIRSALPDRTPLGIHKIRHVVIIMQENRSFDEYFGTYPGADGIPGLAGNPGKVPCLPYPGRRHCMRPYHDTRPTNFGGPHAHSSAMADIANGRMNGFVAQAVEGKAIACKQFASPWCSQDRRKPDVMGYHDAREIPNYWAYANHFVLQDHMFEADSSWSLPEHLFLVSGWSAHCTKAGDAASCKSAVQDPGSPPHTPGNPTSKPPDYAWTDLTYLLHRY